MKASLNASDSTSYLNRAIGLICSISGRYPKLLLLVALILTLPPSLYQVKKIRLNTNLDRLLPKSSPAAIWKQKLNSAINDGGYFTFLLEGEEREKLLQAVHYAKEQVEALSAVSSVEYRYPLKFIEKYRYLLISSGDLEKIYDGLIIMESELNPAGTDLISADEETKESYGDREEQKYLSQQLNQYGNLPEYHQSKDGKVMGLFIRPLKGVTNLGATRSLFNKLQTIADHTSDKFSLWTGISGSLRNKVDEYDLIISDLGRSGVVASTLILLTLIISFRSALIVPFLMMPLLMGLLWSFSLVPALVGDLNTITSFILLVLFGMGIDYSIHLAKHFQLMLSSLTPTEALIETYKTTGISVGVSGITTAFSLFILSISDFRGFSEFGIVGGVTIITVLLSMFLLMPACLILGEKTGIIKPSAKAIQTSRFPLFTAKKTTISFILLVTASIAITLTSFSFDYDFSNLKPDIPDSKAVKERHKKVYSTSMSPAALYVAENIEDLDGLLSTLHNQIVSKSTKFGRITSIRDYAPGAAETAYRMELINDIKDQAQGRWIRRIKNEEQKSWINDIKGWSIPGSSPDFKDLPVTLKDRYTTHDGTERFIIGVYPNVERKNGKDAMAFTEELYALPTGSGILGPVGETPIFAEILWLVTKEGPILTSLSLLGILLLVYVNRRSLKETFWILLPLLSGFLLTLALMGAMSFKLNFFNIVVLPTLLGMGVDNGVHFYSRWRQLGGDTRKTLSELGEPLTICTITTMMGYSGMVLAGHPGLRSIGFLACLGLGCTWFSSLVLLPGLLNRPAWRKNNRPDENCEMKNNSNSH